MERSLAGGSRAQIGDEYQALANRSISPASGLNFRSCKLALGSICEVVRLGSWIPMIVVVFNYTSTKRGLGRAVNRHRRSRTRRTVRMKRISKLAVACAAVFFAVLAAPVSSTTATAAPAASAVDMMRALDGGKVSPVEHVDRRGHSRSHRHHRSNRHYRHRNHCRMVKRCWRNSWGRHKCRWVRRCH